MRKYLLILLVFLLLVQPVALATQSGSLTLHYEKNNQAFSGLEIAIYRVAAVEDGNIFTPVAPFDRSGVDLAAVTSQARWQEIAAACRAFTVAAGIAPTAAVTTDETGAAHFSLLEPGLYLVREVLARGSDGEYLFDAFMLYLPDSVETQEVRPKCTGFTPAAQYSVTKLWKESGDSQRPDAVTVDIYCDGVLRDTQLLSAANNWTYTWTTLEAGIWTVAEREIPDGYRVSIRQNGGDFSIINTRNPGPEDPPPTGDSFAPLPWILAMCLSGLLLLLLGIRAGRHK